MKINLLPITPVTRSAMITSAHPPLDVRIFYKELKSLSSANYLITFLAPTQSSAAEALAKTDIKYIPLGEFKNRFSRINLLWRIMLELRKGSYPTWHFHDPDLLPVLILLRYFFHKKSVLIYDVHEDVPKDILDKPWIHPGLRGLISKTADYIEGWGIKRCDLIIAATDSIAERARRFNEKVITVHNYPKKIAGDIEETPHRGEPTLHLIYAGNITAIRGLREVVQAMALLVDCDVVLHLVGLMYPDSFETELRSSAGPNVRFYGKLPFEESMNIMKKCDIGIVTFYPLPNHVEAMPNKLFEYMQNGLVVIASNFPLWRQIITEAQSGLTVDPYKPDEIASAVRSLLESPDLRQRMGQAGIRAVNELYSWQHEEITLLQAYSDLKRGTNGGAANG
jgi:glycosyltransferase involved in cell wall biosynthesis